MFFQYLSFPLHHRLPFWVLVVLYWNIIFFHFCSFIDSRCPFDVVFNVIIVFHSNSMLLSKCYLRVMSFLKFLSFIHWCRFNCVVLFHLFYLFIFFVIKYVVFVVEFPFSWIMSVLEAYCRFWNNCCLRNCSFNTNVIWSMLNYCRIWLMWFSFVVGFNFGVFFYPCRTPFHQVHLIISVESRSCTLLCSVVHRFLSF